jgi:hypothetical protein
MISGALTANTGYIGGTSGWTISSKTITGASDSKIKSGILESSDWGSAAGSQIDLVSKTMKFGGSSAPKFSVAADGTLTASGAMISGALTANTGYIGGTSGWTITSKTITGASDSKIKSGILESSDWSSGAGSQIDLGNKTLKFGGSSAPKFSVAADGTLTCTSAIVQGSYKTSTTVGTTKGIHLDASSNELYFYADRGDTVIEKLCSIGMPTSGDLEMLQLGTADFSRTCISARNKGSLSPVYVYAYGNAKAVYARSASGIGVYGGSESDYGVYGYTTSATLAAIRGYVSTAGIGVEGYNNSTGYGVKGVSVLGTGIRGESVSSGKYGVEGINTHASGCGVRGYNASGHGVAGETAASGKAGVYGYNTHASGYAIFGYNTTGTAIYGEANASGAAAIAGKTNHASGYSFYGTGNAYFTADVSALTFTDHTPAYVGDALTEIMAIKSTVDGKIDHNTLPVFTQHMTTERVLNKDTQEFENVSAPGRDIGATVSMLVVAIQQLADRLDQLQQGKD